MKRASTAVRAYALVCAGFALASTVLVSATLAPDPSSPMTVVFASQTLSQAVSAILRADGRARIVDVRWSGRMIVLRSLEPAFPARVRAAGAALVFKAVAGCLARPAPAGASA